MAAACPNFTSQAQRLTLSFLFLFSFFCTHGEWVNCPVIWRAQHQRGDHLHSTVMLEVVASHDLWIWHVYLEEPDAQMI